MEIPFMGNNENFYHLLQESNHVQTGGLISGNARITGYTKEQINKDDVLLINNCRYHVVDVVRRDHAGKFNNPADKKNTFFEANCTFQRAQQSK